MGLIRYILGGEGRKNLRRLDKMADKVLALEGKYAAMSDEELKSVTPALKERLAKRGNAGRYSVRRVRRRPGSRVARAQYAAITRCRSWAASALHQGRVAEMKTGEGKTLVATLPAYLNALAGEGVHVVTVNDYLASARRRVDGQGL